MRAVNLLPPELRRGRRLTVPKPAAAGLAFLVIGSGLGLWSHQLSASTAAANHQLTQARAEQGYLQAQLGTYRVAQQRAATLASQRQAVATLTAGRVDWERIIRTVATVLPPQVWLTSLKATTPTSSGPVVATPTAAPVTTGTPVGIHLDGLAFSQTQVAITMARIAAIPGLGAPTLSTSSAQTIGTRNVVGFSLDVPIDQRAQGRLAAAAGGASPINTSTAVVR